MESAHKLQILCDCYMKRWRNTMRRQKEIRNSKAGAKERRCQRAASEKRWQRKKKSIKNISVFNFAKWIFVRDTLATLSSRKINAFSPPLLVSLYDLCCFVLDLLMPFPFSLFRSFVFLSVLRSKYVLRQTSSHILKRAQGDDGKWNTTEFNAYNIFCSHCSCRSFCF